MYNENICRNCEQIIKFVIFLCNSIFLVQFNNFVVMYHCFLLLSEASCVDALTSWCLMVIFWELRLPSFHYYGFMIKAVLFSLCKEERWKYASVCEYTTQSVCSVMMIFSGNLLISGCMAPRTDNPAGTQPSCILIFLLAMSVVQTL